MPRVKLYHTKEDLRKANQAKCQRYYLKNREKILENRLERRAKQKLRKRKSAQRKEDSNTARDIARDRSHSDESGAYWLQHARGIPARLVKVVTRTPRRFLDDLCYAFPKSSSRDTLFTNPRNELKRLRNALHRCEHMILNTYGCGEEFREVEEIDKSVKLAEDWIDDILMVLMEGKDIEREHRSGRLLYQKDTDIVLGKGHRTRA